MGIQPGDKLIQCPHCATAYAERWGRCPKCNLPPMTLDTSRQAILATVQRDREYADSGWEWSSAGDGDCPKCAARDGVIFSSESALRKVLAGQFCDHPFCRCAVGPA